MKFAELYKLYNRKKSKECILIYIMIAISLIISVALSIAIPQIDHSIKNNIDKNAELINGGDIKISANVLNDELTYKINELEEKGIISEINFYDVISSSIKYDGYNIYTTIMKGDYDIADNETIISSYTADDIGINIGDIINVSGKEYKVKSIEEQPCGVTEQAEKMGYCKISNKTVNGLSSYGSVFIINTKEIEKVAEEIKKTEGDFKCTTIEDQKESLKEQLNTNTLAMNMLNTMCIIMTLIAVVSSIFMIINQRKQDISIMKCLSIKTKIIKRSMRYEVKRFLVIPVIIGSLSSIVIANYLLKIKHIEYNIEWNEIIFGALFFLIMYFLFINIITLMISSIDPIAFLRDTKQILSLNKLKIYFFSIIYLILFMFAYAVFYVGNTNAFKGSIIIFFALIAFFIITKLFLAIISIFKHFGKNVKYTFERMKRSSSVTAILIVNLLLIGWFTMFGFTFDKISSSSLHKDLKNKLDYNYIMADSGNGSENTAEYLRKKDIKFTRLHRSVGYITKDENIVRAEIGLIDQIDNKVKFNITDGKKAEELSEGEVLVSEEFADSNEIKTGDTIKFYTQDNSLKKNKEVLVKVSGLYKAGNINQYTMIASDVNSILGKDSVIFLISADNMDFIKGYSNDDIIIADLSVVENALEAYLKDYIFYFKNMCFISMFAVLIFIVNMIFIEYYSNKEIVIIKALGLNKKFLYKSAYLKQFIVNVIGFLSSLGLYYLVLKVLLGSMISSSPEFNGEILTIPILIFAGIFILCSLSERIFINNNCTKYEMLREKD